MELLPFAENLYRRFPEEFIALGMPGLEDIYDLRPNGTWSRHINETPMEKTVEITIRRWHMPTLQPPQGGPFAPSYAPQQLYPQANPWAAQQAMAYAAPPSLPHHPCAFAMPCGYPQGLQQQCGIPSQHISSLSPEVDDQASVQLLRLEAQLSAVKSQMEAAVKAQQARIHSHQAASAMSSGSRHAVGDQLARVSSRVADRGASSQDPVDLDNTNDLRSRRHVAQLQIMTTPKDKAVDKKPEATVLKLEAETTHDDEAVESSAKMLEGSAKASKEKEKDDRIRPKVSVNTVRVAPSAMDPASPRSPGRYSVWK